MHSKHLFRGIIGSELIRSMQNGNGAGQFAVYIEQDEDGVFIGSIPSIPGCHAQGETQEAMLKNLREVVILCLRNTDQYERIS